MCERLRDRLFDRHNAPPVVHGQEENARLKAFEWMQQRYTYRHVYFDAFSALGAATEVFVRGELPGACLLFAQGLELSLKAFLYEFRETPRHEFMAVYASIARLWPTKQLPEVADIEYLLRNQGMDAAFSRVNALVQFTPAAQRGFDEIRQMRNRVMHSLGEYKWPRPIAKVVILHLLPLIDEFFGFLGIELMDLLGKRFYRELVVAAKYCHLMEHAGEELIHLLNVAWNSRYGASSSGTARPAFRRGTIEEYRDSTGLVNKTMRLPYVVGLAAENGFPTCKICGNHCLVQYQPNPCGESPHNYFEVLGVFCASCGLFLDDSHAALSQLHFGTLNEAVVGEVQWQALLRDESA